MPILPIQLNYLLVPYGGSININKQTLANRGFTVRTFTAAPEGISITVDGTLLTGFTPPANASTQGITFANLSIDPNSGTKFKLAIRPNTAGINDSLFRESNPSLTQLESLNYNFNNSTGIDRSMYLFSGTTLGTDDVIIQGSVNAAAAGARPLTGVTAGTPTTFGSTAGTIGGTLGPALVGNENYGSWPVEVSIPALLTNYNFFTLLAGSPVPDDLTFETICGIPVKFSTMTNVVDVNGNFISNFHVNPTKYQIVKQFISTKVKFYAGANIPEGTTIYIGDYSSIGAIADLSIPGNFMQYAYGVYPIFHIHLPQGSMIDIAVDVAEGFVVPGGQIIPTGSFFTDASGATPSSLTLPDFRGGAGFTLSPGVSLTGVILMAINASIKKGLTSSLFQSVMPGMSTNDSLSMEGVQFPSGSALEADLTLDNEFNVIEPITLARSSTLKKGTRIPKGSQTLEGALIDSSINIARGAVVTNRIEIKSPFVLDASIAGSNPIFPGAILNAPFIFLPGTQITSGNVLPAALKLLTTMGVTLASGMKIAAGTIFGSTAMLFGDIGFSPRGSIPALSTLFGSFNIPFGTRLLSGFTANFQVPVPDHTVFRTGSLIHAGTSFKEGSRLPIPDFLAQAPPSYSGSGPGVGPISKFIDPITGIVYLVLKAGTVFLPNWIFPVGTVLSRVALPGHTKDFLDPTWGAIGNTVFPYTTPYELAPGSYSLDESVNAPAQDTFTFTPGIPTTELIFMLTDTTLPTDVVIPYSGINSNAGEFLSFNEIFTLLTDVILPSNYTVHGSNNTIWPAGVPIPTDFIFSSSYTFITPIGGSQISKTIQFNVMTINQFINGIVGVNSSIKLPPSGFVLDLPIQLGVNQPVASTGVNAFKSTVTLASGTLLNLVGPFIQLIIPMTVSNNFTVGAELLVFPQTRLENGIVLLAGHPTPGDIIVGINSPLPKNLLLDQDITLAADLETREHKYSLNKYAYLAPGSILAKGTKFPSGANFILGVTMASILSLSVQNVFFIFEDNELTTDIMYPYLWNFSTNSILVMKTDARGLILKIIDLQNSLSADSLAIAALQAEVAALGSNRNGGGGFRF
jgi:hypothetical protein